MSDIVHFGAVRIRVTGTGDLKMKLISLGDVHEKVLADSVMSDPAYKLINVWTNFNQQRARLRVETTEIDEVFSINKIILYVKPVATGYPQ